MAATGSIDRTCKIWDILSGHVIHTFTGHSDEILDINFNSAGSKLVSASADKTARVFDVKNGNCINVLQG